METLFLFSIEKAKTVNSRLHPDWTASGLRSFRLRHDDFV